MTVFAITMLVLTFCTCLELTTNFFTKKFNSFGRFLENGKVKDAEKRFKAAEDTFAAESSPKRFEELQKAKLELDTAKFLRDVHN